MGRKLEASSLDVQANNAGYQVKGNVKINGIPSTIQLNRQKNSPVADLQLRIKLDEASRRRSLYFVHSHNEQQKFLSTFDDANVLDCYRRAESIVPQQALALENSQLATAMAGKIAQRIAAAHPNAADAEFIRVAFVTILSVEPTADEQATVSEVLKRLTELARTKGRPNPEVLARTNLIQTLLNHNDFITIR